MPGVYDNLGVGGGQGARFAPPRPAVNEQADRTGPATGDEYARAEEDRFFRVADAPLSTFSIDVDTASYSNVRRFLAEGHLPPPGAVRIEEMLNSFRYDYPAPEGDRPFSVCVEEHAAPWAPGHRLVRIGLRGREADFAQAPAANLVFLVDVSGSMSSPDRLPLVKASLRLLVERLRAQDRISVVVYAGSSGLALPATGGNRKEEILAAIDRLQSGGSTNGAEGIELAYQTASENFVKGGINRVILCTDGDFNVGVSSAADLASLIEEKRKTGVFLSVLGYGRGNYADRRMQELADKGNGNAAYIDSIDQARKMLVEQMTGTLWTIAKDVKIQVEFNPAKVAGYRLIGYENRMLAARDFNDDRKDAGEIGMGHQVTALYEIVPAGQEVDIAVDPLKYQPPAQQPAPAAPSNETLTVKLRFKKPDGVTSDKIEVPFVAPAVENKDTPDFDFAASVAMFGMLLRDSSLRGAANWGLVLELAKGGIGEDVSGERKAFVELARLARKTEER
ncbi:MAG: VWA domain-containing protein [Planctomycetes bacterium]|nr:VWA domain-containing protein [Planctomycetota bacterium]